MDKKKTIYLHIGMPKTGSSSIQTFLWENSELLQTKGLYYPQILSPIPTLQYFEKYANFRKAFAHKFLEDSAPYCKKGNINAFIECWNNEYLPLIE